MTISKQKFLRPLVLGLLCNIVIGMALLCGCEVSSSYETSVSLLPPEADEAESAAETKTIDPSVVLATVEKIAARAGLKPYVAGREETSLLDIADTDLLGDSYAASASATEYKHPDLPVYLTVTRKPEEILMLLHHAPDENGEPNPEAVKLYKTIQEKLAAAVNALKEK